MARDLDRIYQLVKVATGDYLMPGNTGRTLWRLRLEPDGERQIWKLYRWGLDYGIDAERDLCDPDDWSQWEQEEEGGSRSVIIRRALELELDLVPASR